MNLSPKQRERLILAAVAVATIVALLVVMPWLAQIALDLNH